MNEGTQLKFNINDNFEVSLSFDDEFNRLLTGSDFLKNKVPETIQKELEKIKENLINIKNEIEKGKEHPSLDYYDFYMVKIGRKNLVAFDQYFVIGIVKDNFFYEQKAVSAFEKEKLETLFNLLKESLIKKGYPLYKTVQDRKAFQEEFFYMDNIEIERTEFLKGLDFWITDSAKIGVTNCKVVNIAYGDLFNKTENWKNLVENIIDKGID